MRVVAAAYNKICDAVGLQEIEEALLALAQQEVRVCWESAVNISADDLLYVLLQTHISE